MYICCFLGVNPTEVQQRVEDHLKAILIKHFDPKKADSIFSEEGGVCFTRKSLKNKARWRNDVDSIVVTIEN